VDRIPTHSLEPLNRRSPPGEQDLGMRGGLKPAGIGMHRQRAVPSMVGTGLIPREHHRKPITRGIRHPERPKALGAQKPLLGRHRIGINAQRHGVHRDRPRRLRAIHEHDRTHLMRCRGSTANIEHGASEP
jgi:hypothetical protein